MEKLAKINTEQKTLSHAEIEEALAYNTKVMRLYQSKENLQDQIDEVNKELIALGERP